MLTKKKIAGRPKLLTVETAGFTYCPGCQEPLTARIIAEVLEEIGMEGSSIGVFDIGCNSFLNLVSNAIDACIESETGDLVIVKSHDRGYDMLFTVDDNGIGMDENTVKRIFERFYTTKPWKGTGLGLPVVQKIVEAHGGKVEVKSKLGKGTVFYLQLPKNPSK